MNAKKSRKATATTLTVKNGARNMVNAEKGSVGTARGAKRSDGKSMGMSAVRREGLRKGGRMNVRRGEMSIVRKGGRMHMRSAGRITKREEKITRRGVKRDLMIIEELNMTYLQG